MTEIWDLVLLQEDKILVTGGSDAELKIWTLEFQEPAGEEEDGEGGIKSRFVTKEPQDKKVRKELMEEGEDEKEEEPEDDNSVLRITRIGSILRSGDGRLQHLGTDLSNRILASHGTDNSLELFLICNEEEIQKRLAKKAKKERKRTGAEVDISSIKPSIQEQFRRIKPIKVSGKIKSIDLQCYKKKCRVLMVLANNQLEVVDFETSLEAEGESLMKVETPGHRSDVRTLAFSSDNTALLTASSEGVKVNRKLNQLLNYWINSMLWIRIRWIPEILASWIRIQGAKHQPKTAHTKTFNLKTRI